MTNIGSEATCELRAMREIGTPTRQRENALFDLIDKMDEEIARLGGRVQALDSLAPAAPREPFKATWFRGPCGCETIPEKFPDGTTFVGAEFRRAPRCTSHHAHALPASWTPAPSPALVESVTAAVRAARIGSEMTQDARYEVIARAALAAVAAAGRLIRSDAREPIRDEIAKWFPKASLDITHRVADGVLRLAAARPGEE